MSKILYLIGNGFDRHHNLLTGYNDYKEYLRGIDENLVELIDKRICELLPWLRTDKQNENIKLWSKLEEYLRLFHDIDFDSWFDEAIANSEDDMDSGDYFDGPRIYAEVIADDYKKIIFGIKKHFQSWIDSIDLTTVQKDQNFIFDKNDLYLNFNYTKTLEYVYDIPSENNLHIHINNGQYILGHNDDYSIPFSDPMYSYVEKSNGMRIPVEDSNQRRSGAREAFNSLYHDVFYEYYKNSSHIIELNQPWFDRITDCDKLIIMGLSLGQEDVIYIEELAKKMHKLNEIDYYYHTEDDLERMEEVLEIYFKNIKSRPIKW